MELLDERVFAHHEGTAGIDEPSSDRVYRAVVEMLADAWSTRPSPDELAFLSQLSGAGPELVSRDLAEIVTEAFLSRQTTLTEADIPDMVHAIRHRVWEFAARAAIGRLSDRGGDEARRLLERWSRFVAEDRERLLREREQWRTQFELKRKAFETFVPQALYKSGESRIERCPKTVLFLDIRDSVSRTEFMSHDEFLAFIKSFLRLIVPVFHEFRGYVVKFIGDGIMGVWDEDVPAGTAVAAAIAMQTRLAEYSRTQARPLEAGIGINTGEVDCGIIGASGHMQVDVMGDNVNIAARLQALTRDYHVNIILSDSTLRQLGDAERAVTRHLDKVQVRGRDQPVVIHEVFGADPRRTLKTQLMPVYCDGLDAYYETRFEAAYARFAQYLEAFPDDHVVREYAKRARYFILHGAPPNWEGTVRINEPFVPPHARRGFPRFRLPGTARIESGVDERQDGLDDISGSGVGIISEQRLGVGSLVPVTIRIHFRQDGRVVDETFRLKGSVKRITDKDAGRWEYGLEIVCIEPADERRLNETLYREESRAYRVR